MDIAIIGVGIIDSLGTNKDQCWDNMLNGVVGMSPSKFYDKVSSVHNCDIDSIDISSHFTTKERSTMDRAFVLAMHSTLQCINDANVNSTDVSMFVGMNSTMKTLELTAWDTLQKGKRTSPRQMYFAMKDSITSTICRLFGYTGMTSTVSNMCTTSLNALDYACRSLEDSAYSLVVATDSFVLPLDMYVMHTMGALSSDCLTRPFDKNRNGITLSEGSCAYMLTSLENAKSKNHKIYGIIKGIGHGTEAVHGTDMSTDGIGSRNAINMALRKARLINNDIGYVNCHATGTPQGDVVEYDIISSMFPGIIVGANKANIGHTMGACGLLELFYTMLALNHQVAPPIANLIDSIGSELHLPKTKTSIDARYALKNSFGFGGKSSCVIIEKGTV